MSSNKKTPPSKSGAKNKSETSATPVQPVGKLSAKERREAARKQQQQLQMIIVVVVAAAIVIGLIGAIVLNNQSKADAFIPELALSRYKELAAANMTGVTPEGYPYLGAENAPTLIEEISSFACPFCKQYHDQNLVGILDLLKAGKAKFVYIPVTTTGEFNPTVATNAAYCALDQGKFWEMHDIFFDWQTRYGNASNDMDKITTAANAVGLDVGKLKECINQPATTDRTNKGNELMGARGVNATPTIFIDGKQMDNQTPLDLGQLRGLIEAKPAKQ